MNTFTLYAIAAPLNAFIFCACITFALKNFHLKSHIRALVTFVVYTMLAFAMSAGGNGLLNLDVESFNLVQFLLYTASGLCVCLFLFLFYERGNIGSKIEARRNNKKDSK